MRMLRCTGMICPANLAKERANVTNAWSYVFFFFQAEDGIRDLTVTGVQTCALPIYEEYQFTSHPDQRILVGQMVPQNGIVLSRKDLIRAFENPHAAYHVGLHEFAHALDRKSVV